MAESVRTFWKGYLRLALVTIPIRLVSAERAQATPRFHQIDRKSKQRIRYLKVAPGKGEVPSEDIVMGYEVEPGNYVLIEKDELEGLRLESRHTIELVQFVDADDIDPLYFERPYYILPDGDVAEEGYRVIRDALRDAKKVAIGQLTLRGRENLVALYPGGEGLVLDTLRYEDEIKDADSIFSEIGKGKTRADMLEMAEQLIKSRSGPFDPSKFKNHYAEALRDFVKRKVASGGSVPIESESAPGAKVIDFMEALKRSVQQSGKDKSEDRSEKPARAVAGRAAKSAVKSSTKKSSQKPAARSKTKTPSRTRRAS
ncbi:MAG: Ku protein [Hyphomicrobiales bacterium]|nr:Ku protein [Hyphomicrobiales bacterium]